MAKLLLFDIDGTLLRTQGASSRAFLRAGEQVLGEYCRHAPLNPGGALDPLLFRELAHKGGHRVTEALHAEFRAAYVRELARELDGPARPTERMPGVLELLVRLRTARPAVLGMLTGNYAETGRLKLERAGIEPDWFEPVIWGDCADSRPGLVRHALGLRPEVRPFDVIVIGDTPKDVACALENGARCLAVATGFHSVEALEAAGATRAVENLLDPTPLYELLSSEA